MSKYMNKKDTAEFLKEGTTKTRKNELRKAAEAKAEARYDIMSIEKFVKQARDKDGKLTQWATAFTKNRLLIFDEVHNLLSTGYDPDLYAKVLREGKLAKSMKSINAVIFKYMVQKADPSCKMVFMTATPVFDHASQFKELVRMMSPESQPRLTEPGRSAPPFRSCAARSAIFQELARLRIQR